MKFSEEPFEVRLFTVATRPLTVLVRFVNEVDKPETVVLIVLRLLVSEAMDVLFDATPVLNPLTVELKPFTVLVSPEVVLLSPVTVVDNPETVVPSVATVLCSVLSVPLVGMFAISVFNVEMALLMLARSELRSVTWSIAMGKVAYWPFVGVVVVPPDPSVELCRT
jgi:hypothetical protein